MLSVRNEIKEISQFFRVSSMKKGFIYINSIQIHINVNLIELNLYKYYQTAVLR